LYNDMPAGRSALWGGPLVLPCWDSQHMQSSEPEASKPYRVRPWALTRLRMAPVLLLRQLFRHIPKVPFPSPGNLSARDVSSLSSLSLPLSNMDSSEALSPADRNMGTRLGTPQSWDARNPRKGRIGSRQWDRGRELDLR